MSADEVHYCRGVRSIRGLLPITKWLPQYDRGHLRHDVIAGVTVSALVVPKALGYAGIASVPLEAGLYAAAAGAIFYALFGTSRQISTGPSSALAAVAGSAVALSGLGGDEAPELVAAIAIAAGLLFLVMAVFKLGWISRFLSKAVITGFLAGAAVEVVIGEIPKITGTTSEGNNSWQKLADWLRDFDGAHNLTLLVGLAALAAILILRFTVPKLPGALVLVVGGLIASVAFDLDEHGVATVGDVPRGVPTPALPGWGLITDHAPTIGTAAVALVLIGFSQTAGDARLFAARHAYRIDVDQESVAQGMANVGAGVFQGMPVSTSLSASSLNDAAGARTQMASAVTGAAVVLTLLAFAPLFSDLPKAVLAALIIDAVVFGMIDIPELRRLWSIKRFDFWIAAAAIFAVLGAGVLAGVMIGMVLSIGWLIYVTVTPETPELGRRPGTTAFRSLGQFPDGETHPGMLIMRFDGSLFFATADPLEDRLREAAIDAGGELTSVIIDFAGVDFIDSQGAAKMTEVFTLANSAGISSRLARVKPPVFEVLQADGYVDLLGRDRFHANIDGAVAAELESRAAAGAASSDTTD